MSNILDRFNKTVVGSRGKVGDYVSRIVPSGDFKRITDLEVIVNSWSNILITPTRSYIYDPEFGSDLYKMVFEPADDRTIDNIKREVITKLQRYDNRAIIQSIDIKFNNNRKGFTVSVVATYNNEEANVNVAIDESLYFKFFESTGTTS